MAVVMGVRALAARFGRRRQGLSPGRRPGPGSGARSGAASGGGGLASLWGGSRASRRPRPEATIDVVSRRSLAKGAWVTLVESSGKRFLVGVTEHNVTLLCELPAEAPVLAETEIPAVPTQDWPQAGRMPVSLVDVSLEERPDNAWKLALESLRERTVRR
jgi:hypothetical protein